MDCRIFGPVLRAQQAHLFCTGKKEKYRPAHLLLLSLIGIGQVKESTDPCCIVVSSIVDGVSFHRFGNAEMVIMGGEDQIFILQIGIVSFYHTDNISGRYLAVFSVQGNIHRYPRSEEHTSELQSRGHLVCRLLLEKRKTR